MFINNIIRGRGGGVCEKKWKSLVYKNNSNVHRFQICWYLVVAKSVEHQIVFDELVAHTGTGLIAQIGSVAA